MTVPLDAPQLTLLLSQFFLVCKVIQIQDIQNLICISSRHGPEAPSFAFGKFGARRREHSPVFLSGHGSCLPADGKQGLRASSGKENRNLAVPCGHAGVDAACAPKRRGIAGGRAGPSCSAGGQPRSETRALPQGRAVVRRHFVLRSWLLAGSSASPLLTAGGRAFFVGGRAVHCTMVRSILTSTCRMPGASPVVVVTTERSPGLTKVGQRAQSAPRLPAPLK